MDDMQLVNRVILIVSLLPALLVPGRLEICIAGIVHASDSCCLVDAEAAPTEAPAPVSCCASTSDCNDVEVEVAPSSCGTNLPQRPETPKNCDCCIVIENDLDFMAGLSDVQLDTPSNTGIRAASFDVGTVAEAPRHTVAVASNAPLIRPLLL